MVHIVIFLVKCKSWDFTLDVAVVNWVCKVILEPNKHGHWHILDVLQCNQRNSLGPIVINVGLVRAVIVFFQNSGLAVLGVVNKLFQTC